MKRWFVWAGYAAAVWSLVYGALGVVWMVRGSGFPFGSGDREASLSLLFWTTPAVGAPAVAVLGLAGAAAGLAMARGRGPRPLLLGFGWTAAALLALVIPDYRVLMLIAYTPILLVSWPFGGLPVNYAEALSWPRLNLLVLVAGGLLWAIAALSYQRRTAGACGNCGRRDLSHQRHWTTPESARRWGRWAVHVAAIVPEIYGITRYAWAVGIPLGIDPEFHRRGMEDGTWLVGAALGVLGTLGAILTIGLNRRWSEIWPRWVPVLRGRPVPVMFPVVFAGVVAVVVFSAGLMFWVQVGRAGFDWSMWAAGGPQMLWPVWAVALGAAALGYYLRMRTTCRICGRGEPRGVSGGEARPTGARRRTRPSASDRGTTFTPARDTGSGAGDTSHKSSEGRGNESGGPAVPQPVTGVSSVPGPHLSPSRNTVRLEPR